MRVDTAPYSDSYRVWGADNKHYVYISKPQSGKGWLLWPPGGRRGTPAPTVVVNSEVLLDAIIEAQLILESLDGK